MGKKLVNLTLPLVIEAVENILALYPEYPYQIAFAPSGLRQDLIAYVLSRVPNTYTVAEEDSSSASVLPSCSSEQRVHIEHLIHLGIRDVLHIYSRKNCYLP